MQATEIQEAPTTKEKEQQEKEAASRSYSFTCESGSAKSIKSPKLVVPPPGVQIFFMRYGLVKEDLSSHPYHWPTGKKISLQKPVGAPALEGFRYARTRMRDGWIYIYKEDKKTLLELDVSPIDLNLSYTLFKDKTIWACYSETSWDKEYKDIMTADASLRATRMQKITFADWWHKQSHEDGCHIGELDAVFQDPLDLQAFKQKYESVKAIDIDPRKEYLFFCLHDQLDIAQQLHYNLLDEWNKMDSLLISIKTGIS